MNMKNILYSSLLILLLSTFTGCGSQATDYRVNANTAVSIALEHADLTADDVTGLHTEHDIDKQMPYYEVEFYHDYTKYEYDIHAETGEIISFDKDN